MRIQQITFSPTGGTLKVCRALCSGFKCDIIETETCVKSSQLKLPTISADDIVVIGMPVFAGRVPNMAAERLRLIKSNQAKCVIVAVYGNREYEDALVEMQDIASECGYKVIAAVCAIAEHSVIREFAAGRPDDNDADLLAKFATIIKVKAESASEFSKLTLPGNRPYRKPTDGPTPIADETCTRCGVCADECPVDAISIENPQIVKGEACISCMRCVSTCPTGSRSLGQIATMLTERLRPVCTAPKQNELYI